MAAINLFFKENQVGTQDGVQNVHINSRQDLTENKKSIRFLFMVTFELSVSKTKHGNPLVTLSGALNESVNMGKVDWSGMDSDVTIDLGEVGHFNSVGVSLWLKWVKTLNGSLKLIFSRVPFAFVSHATQIKNFIPESAKVESFILPYYCNDCGETTTKDIENTGPHTFDSVTESIACRNCGKDSQLDVLADKYGDFLKRRA